MVLVFVFVKCGMFSKKFGGMGGYVEYVFGCSGNFMVNYIYVVFLLIVNVVIVIFVVGYVDVLFGFYFILIEICIVIILVLWVVIVVNFGGVCIIG